MHSPEHELLQQILPHMPPEELAGIIMSTTAEAIADGETGHEIVVLFREILSSSKMRKVRGLLQGQAKKLLNETRQTTRRKRKCRKK